MFQGPQPGGWCKLHVRGQCSPVMHLFTLRLNCSSAATAIWQMTTESTLGAPEGLDTVSVSMPI